MAERVCKWNGTWNLSNADLGRELL